MREYTDTFLVRFKEGERDIVRRKMEEAGIRNMAAYIRKMAIDGYVIRLDLSDVKEVARLLRINSNNLNQYAKRARQHISRGYKRTTASAGKTLGTYESYIAAIIYNLRKG